MIKLRLLKLILRGYTPFSLSSISGIVYEPESDWQLILGTNGSGKSSILRAATPTITDRSEFEIGGYKESHWMDADGFTYILISNYGKSIKHSFVRVNGSEREELNPGGTGTVYKELVNTYFSYNANTHGLLTQSTTFTEMNKNQRESLLLDVTECDLSYPMAIYNDLRTRARDVSGAIKRLAVKQTTISQKLDTFTDIEDMRLKIGKLRNELKRITTYVDWEQLGKEPKAKEYIDGHLSRLEGLFSSFNGLTNRISGSMLSIKSLEIQELDIVTLSAKVDELNNEYNKNLGAKNKVLEDLTRYSYILDKIEETKDTDVSELELQICSILNSYDAESAETYKKISDSALQDSIGAYNRHRLLVDQIPGTIEYVPYNIAQEHIAIYEQAKVNVGKLEALIRIEEESIKHLREVIAGKVTCTSCSHSFIPGANDNVDALIKEAITNKDKYVDLLIKEEEKVIEKEPSFTNALALIDYVTEVRATLSRSFHRHSDLPDMERIVNSPNSLTQYLMGSITQCQKAIKYKEDMVKVDHLEELVKLTVLAKDGNVSDKYNSLEAQLEIIQGDMSFCLDFKDKVTYVINSYKKLEGYAKEIEEVKALLDKDLIRYVKATNIYAYTNQAKLVETELTSLLSTTRVYEDLLSNQVFLNNEYDELKSDEAGFAALITAIGPKTGLIAEVVRSTLTTFTEQVNAILDSIWEHKLNMCIPNISSGELDYIFPLIVDSSVKSDISKGSTGEQDVINFAVRLVIMARKNLSGYPLFMDEVGSSFDPVHRTNLMDYIKSLVSAGHIGQIFMVNHFATEYGGISNADVSILNSNNVRYKGVHNKCLQVTYK